MYPSEKRKKIVFAPVLNFTNENFSIIQNFYETTRLRIVGDTYFIHDMSIIFGFTSLFRYEHIRNIDETILYQIIWLRI